MRVVHVYGLTETYGPYTVCEEQESWSALPVAERSRLKARQGVGMLTADAARVVATTGDPDRLVDVPADGVTMGEIVMRGNTVMKEYFRDPDATAEAFRGGWFHSGDLGVRHPDGYIQLLDRAKDIVISGGENISTIEVENALMSHPAVADVAVIAVPDERWGERPKAFVVLAAGQHADQAELIAHVKAHIAKFKAPKVGRLRPGGAQDVDREAPQAGVARRRMGRTREQGTGLTALPMPRPDVLHGPELPACDEGLGSAGAIGHRVLGTVPALHGIHAQRSRRLTCGWARAGPIRQVALVTADTGRPGQDRS